MGSPGVRGKEGVSDRILRLVLILCGGILGFGCHDGNNDQTRHHLARVGPGVALTGTRGNTRTSAKSLDIPLTRVRAYPELEVFKGFC